LPLSVQLGRPAAIGEAEQSSEGMAMLDRIPVH